MQHLSTHQQIEACNDKTLYDRARATLGNLALLLRRIGRRRHLVSLNELSNQQLSDIGLHRDDIYESAALGMGDDVTVHLARIAKRRRYNIHRSGTCKSN